MYTIQNKLWNMICSWTFHMPKRKRQSWLNHCSVVSLLLFACLPFLTAEICFWWHFTIISFSLHFFSSSHSDSDILQWQVTLRSIFYLRMSNQVCVKSCLLCNSGKRADYTCINGLNTFIHWNMKDSDKTVLRWKLEPKKSALCTHKLLKIRW